MGREEEENEGFNRVVCLSFPPARDVVGLMHNPTENHLWNMILSSTEGKGQCS